MSWATRTAAAINALANALSPLICIFGFFAVLAFGSGDSFDRLQFTPSAGFPRAVRGACHFNVYFDEGGKVTRVSPIEPCNHP